MKHEIFGFGGLVAALVLLVMGAADSSLARAREGVTVTSRHEATFALNGSGANLEPGPQKGSQAGTAEPGPGEITIGISTTHAVGLPKLHVFERSTKAIAFKVVAMRGARHLATQELCGVVDSDSWIVLPARTDRVIASHFVERDKPCP